MLNRGSKASDSTPDPQDLIETCLICRRKSCRLVTHRLTTLEVLRRVSKGNRQRRVKVRTPTSPNSRLLSPATEARARASYPLPIRPAAPGNLIDSFIRLPLDGLDKSASQLFRDFFVYMGRSVLQFHPVLSFDSGHLPHLFGQTLQNPALCMSIIAMAATYAGTHGQDLNSPTKDLLVIYAKAFGELRRQIQVEASGEISEQSIMAAVNLCMCCGIGFCDVRAALMHWDGVLALMQKPRHSFYSGTLITFVDYIEYWLAITTGFTPPDRWMSALPYERAPAKKYGRAFDSLFKLPMLRYSPAQLKTLEFCQTACRAVEILEADATRYRLVGSAPPNNYFIYLRSVVSAQGAQVYSQLRFTNTFAECISITVNLIYLLILRRTPWRAPLRLLCARLKQAMLSVSEFFEDDKQSSGSGIFSLEKLAFGWILSVYACAALLSRDPAHIEWTRKGLQEVQERYSRTYGGYWKARVVQDLNEFVWSELLLSGHLEHIYAKWAERDLNAAKG